MGRTKIVRTYPVEVEWVLKNRALLSYRKIEQKLGIPETTLYKVASGRISLNETYWHKIGNFVRSFVDLGEKENKHPLVRKNKQI